MNKPDRTLYINVWRSGGYLNAKWHETVPVYGAEDARKQAEDVGKMGYKVITRTLAQHKVVGLPIGYCSKCDSNTGRCRGKNKFCRASI